MRVSNQSNGMTLFIRNNLTQLVPLIMESQGGNGDLEVVNIYSLILQKTFLREGLDRPKIVRFALNPVEHFNFIRDDQYGDGGDLIVERVIEMRNKGDIQITVNSVHLI